MREKIPEIVEQLSGLENEYVCVPLEEYLNGLRVPVPLNKQPGVILLLVSDGILDIKIGYNDFQIKKGELVIIQPQKPYAIEKVRTNVKGMALFIKGDGMIGTMGNHSLIFSLDILETWSDSKYHVDDKLFGFIENIFNRIWFEYKHPSNNLTIVNAYVITLLIELKAIQTLHAGKNISAINITRKFKNEVFHSIDINLPVSDFAKRLSLSTNHLNKSVKAVTGMSATQLLAKIKITEAKYLLFMADLTVADIAARLGFDDPSYFSRFFKKHEDITPLDFRKKIELS